MFPSSALDVTISLGRFLAGTEITKVKLSVPAIFEPFQGKYVSRNNCATEQTFTHFSLPNGTNYRTVLTDGRLELP